MTIKLRVCHVGNFNRKLDENTKMGNQEIIQELPKIVWVPKNVIRDSSSII